MGVVERSAGPILSRRAFRDLLDAPALLHLLSDNTLFYL